MGLKIDLRVSYILNIIMSICDICKKNGHKHVTIWYNEWVKWEYDGSPPFQKVMFPLLCKDCLTKFKKLDKVIFYDDYEFRKDMNNDAKNIYDSAMSSIVDENEYLEHAYEIYNNM